MGCRVLDSEYYDYVNRGDGFFFIRPESSGVENGELYTKVVPTGVETQWTKSYTDFLGRTYKSVYADDTASPLFYNQKGQLVKQLDPAGRATLYQYGDKGELAKSAVDMNGNGVIDDGADKVTNYSNSVTGGVRRQTVTQNNVVVSVSDTSLNGLSSSQTSFGRTTSSSTVLNGNGSKTVTATNPDGSTVTQNYQNGLLMSSVHSVLGTTTFTYDAHGRLASTSQTTGNGLQATAYSYNANDQVTQITENGSRITGFTYDSMGRRTSMTLPGNRTVNYTYAPTGELASVSGADTYPVAYSYDALGRMKRLSTYRETGSADITTWNYDPARGFLTSKVYPNGARISYANNAGGQPVSRASAQGASTLYSYNAAGELTGVDYSDSTPDVSFTRDLFGRPTSITDGTGTRTLSYNQDSSISSETIPYIPDRAVVYSYDSFGRRTTMELKNSSTSELQSSYSYDSMFRLSSVSSLLPGASVPVASSYSRVSDTSLLSSTSISNGSSNVLTVNRSYDSLNRLTSISSLCASVPVASFTYVYNNSDRRSKATLADSSYWEYGYDDKGQVTSGRKYSSTGQPINGQEFEYSYDQIGNRKYEQRNGNRSEYTANEANQYTQRTVPRKVDITGSAEADADVAIYQLSKADGEKSVIKPYRNGNYFHKSYVFDNSADSVEDTFNIFAVKHDDAQNKDIIAKQVEKIFLAKNPEIFQYDPDGNLTQNGKDTFVYDAENRMLSATPIVPSVNSNKVEFKYDYMGRRVEKKVYSWVSNDWQLSKTEKFVFDGWNQIAVFDASNTLQKSCLWGEDLSGSLQGAGGVGGLLAVFIPSTSSTYFPCYNGNGDIMAYVNSAGAKAAEFEYSPDPKIIVKSGSKADELAEVASFSTKPYDKDMDAFIYPCRILKEGRWLSRDRIEEVGGLNLYSTGNDLINKFDPFGEALVPRKAVPAIPYRKPPTAKIDPAFDGDKAPAESKMSRHELELSAFKKFASKCEATKCIKEAHDLANLYVSTVIKFRIDWKNSHAGHIGFGYAGNRSTDVWTYFVENSKATITDRPQSELENLYLEGYDPYVVPPGPYCSTWADAIKAPMEAATAKSCYFRYEDIKNANFYNHTSWFPLHYQWHNFGKMFYRPEDTLIGTLDPWPTSWPIVY